MAVTLRYFIEFGKRVFQRVDETPKSTTLADFTPFQPLCVQIRLGSFRLGVTTGKKSTTKSHI